MSEPSQSGVDSSKTVIYGTLTILLAILSIILTQFVLNSATGMILEDDSSGGVLFAGILSAWFLFICLGVMTYHFERWMTRYRPDRRSAWSWGSYGVLIGVVLLLTGTNVAPVIWVPEEVSAVSTNFQLRLALPVAIAACVILLLGNREKHRLDKYDVIKYIRPR